MIKIKRIIRYILETIKFYLFLPFFKNKVVRNINLFERKVYSQNGEDGIIQLIFKKICTTNKYFVEIGTEDGQECNTRYLKKNNWKGVWVDFMTFNNPEVKKEFITKENIEKIFKKYNIPRQFDLLSIDIDGNDYWIWRALKSYEPRVVVIEYNSNLGSQRSLTIPYDPGFITAGDDFFGASLKALYKLAKKKGYVLIGCDSRGVNAFFIKKNLIEGKFLNLNPKDAYKAPKYGIKINNKYLGQVESRKLDKMVTV